jgi:hypothetical protein
MDYQIPNFHVIPKLHKTYIGLPPSRPITGAIKWITTSASILIDIQLQRILEFLPNSAIIINSSQLIEHIEKFNYNISSDSPHYFLFTIDVVSLYPTIELKQLYKLLAEENPILADITKFICENNYVTYCDLVYKQMKGLATGTNSAVSLANFYLAKLLDNKLTNNTNIKFFKRYIDDIFGIWLGTELEFKEFISITQTDSIQLTYDISNKKVIFLDLEISINKSNTINYTTYQKPTARFQYISFFSNHPKHTKTGMIKGELLRYKRNSSNRILFQETKKLFFQRLLKMGYPPQLLNQQFEKVTWDIPTPLQLIDNNYVASPLIVTYNKFQTNLFYKLNKILHNFEPQLQEQFQYKKPKLFVSYKTNHSTKRMLTTSKLTRGQILFLNNKPKPRCAVITRI